MVSLVNSHTNATSTSWHLWEIDLRFAPGLPPGWIISPDARAHPTNLLSIITQIVLFIDDQLVRVHFITEMIQWTNFAPWVMLQPVPDGLGSTVLDLPANVGRQGLLPLGGGAADVEVGCGAPPHRDGHMARGGGGGMVVGHANALVQQKPRPGDCLESVLA